MTKHRKYILLGKNSKISKYLYKEIVSRQLEVHQLSWYLIKKYGIVSCLLKTLNISFLKSNHAVGLELIIIDCLIGGSDIKYELELHTNLLFESKKLSLDSKFIYLSTFEPSKSAGTDYREMKLILEGHMVKNNAVIIRMGQPIDPIIDSYFDKLNKWQRGYLLTDLRLRPIKIPGTYISEIVDIISNQRDFKSLYKCYSDILYLVLDIKYNPKVLFSLKADNRLIVPIPLFLISYFTKYLSFLLKIINCPSKTTDFFQKFYSIYEHQNILNRTFK